MDYSCQVSLPMGFSRQEYWSGLPCPPPGDLPDPGIDPVSPLLQADSLLLSHWGSPPPPWEFKYCRLKCCSLLFLFPILTSPQNPYLRFCKEPFAKFHSKHNGTYERSVVTTIFANKLMDVGVDVQKYTSHSWWDVFFTKCPTSQKLLPSLTPSLFLWSLYFYWLSEIVIWLTELRGQLVLFSSYTLQPQLSWAWLVGKVKWRLQKQESRPLTCFWPAWTLPGFHACLPGITACQAALWIRKPLRVWSISSGV